MIKSGSISDLINTGLSSSATNKSFHFQSLQKASVDFFVSIPIDESKELICLNPYALLSFLEKVYFINMSLTRDIERALFSDGSVTIDIGLPVPWILASQKEAKEVLVVFSLSEGLEKVIFTISNGDGRVFVCDFVLAEFMQNLESECANSISKTGLLSESPIFEIEDRPKIIH